MSETTEHNIINSCFTIQFYLLGAVAIINIILFSIRIHTFSLDRKACLFPWSQNNRSTTPTWALHHHFNFGDKWNPTAGFIWHSNHRRSFPIPYSGTGGGGRGLGQSWHITPANPHQHINTPPPPETSPHPPLGPMSRECLISSISSGLPAESRIQNTIRDVSLGCRCKYMFISCPPYCGYRFKYKKIMIFFYFNVLE